MHTRTHTYTRIHTHTLTHTHTNTRIHLPKRYEIGRHEALHCSGIEIPHVQHTYDSCKYFSPLTPNWYEAFDSSRIEISHTHTFASCIHKFLTNDTKLNTRVLSPKSVVTYIQILTYYSTLVQRNIPLLQRFRDQQESYRGMGGYD